MKDIAKCEPRNAIFFRDMSGKIKRKTGVIFAKDNTQSLLIKTNLTSLEQDTFHSSFRMRHTAGSVACAGAFS